MFYIKHLLWTGNVPHVTDFGIVAVASFERIVIGTTGGRKRFFGVNGFGIVHPSSVVTASDCKKKEESVTD